MLFFRILIVVVTYFSYFSCRTSTTPAHLSFSQRNKLAVGLGSVCDVFSETVIDSGSDIVIGDPYMTHRASATISAMQFCPYEDVLGISHATG